jgi:hypothetical protein
MLVKSPGGKKSRAHSAAEVEAAIAEARSYLSEITPSRFRLPDRLNEDMRALSIEELWDKTQQGDVDAEYMLRCRAWDALYLTKDTGRLSREWALQIMLLLRFDPPPVKRRRGRRANPDRDFWIVVAIEQVIERGFEPTRNREATGAPRSACAIVAEAFKQMGIKLSERGVETIWAKRPNPFVRYEP